MEANPQPAIKHWPIVSRNPPPHATSSRPPPPPSSNRRYPLRCGDARAHSGLPMSHPSFARTTTFLTAPSTLAAAGNKFRQSRTRWFSFNQDMATKEPKEKNEGRKEEDDGKPVAEAKSEAAPPPPPPPEKPEAGDCCGSGCVRCVWDVYYEELEDYNKIYGSDPNYGAS